MKSVILFVISIWLLLLGTATLVVDLYFNHTLHVMNGSVGAGLIAGCVAFMFPVQFDHLAEKLGPYLPGGVKPTA